MSRVGLSLIARVCGDCQYVEDSQVEVSYMCGESVENHKTVEEASRAGVPPIEDIFSFDEDQVDFVSAQSFPASDPPPSQSTTVPSEPLSERDTRAGDESDGSDS